MITGIVANSVRPVGSAGSALYTDALVAIDFARGEYWAGGVQLTAAALLSRTDMDINADGALFDWNTADLPAVLLQPCIDALGLDGWTVIIEFEESTEDFPQYPLTMYEEGTNYNFLWLDSQDDSMFLYDQAALLDRSLNAAAPLKLSGTPRRVGVTRTVDRMAMSINGGTVTADETNSPYAPYVDTISIGGWISDGYIFMIGRVKSVVFYPAMSDASLQTATNV
jgi:hypothetical protein